MMQLEYTNCVRKNPTQFDQFFMQLISNSLLKYFAEQHFYCKLETCMGMGKSEIPYGFQDWRY